MSKIGDAPLQMSFVKRLYSRQCHTCVNRLEVCSETEREVCSTELCAAVYAFDKQLWLDATLLIGVVNSEIPFDPGRAVLQKRMER